MRSCELDEEIVSRCQKACSGLGNQLVEVTSRKCECSGATDINRITNPNEWAIPRIK